MSDDVIDLRDSAGETALDSVSPESSVAASLRDAANRLAVVSCRLTGRDAAEVTGVAITLLLLAERIELSPAGTSVEGYLCR